MNLNQVRIATQWLALIISNAYLGFVKTKQIYQGTLKSSCVPFLNCHTCPSALFSCPIGTFQHFMTLHRIPYLLIGYLFAIGITVGSMACGWLCPFGFMQDLMYKIKSFKIKIPKQAVSFRYFILFFLVIMLPYITQETWFSKLCPMGTIQAAIPWAIWNPTIPVYNEPAVAPNSLGLLFAIKLLILIIFLGLFIISKRPFCRTVCPLGAIFGFFNKYSILKLKVDLSNCQGCDKCVQTCPSDLNVSDDPDSAACVRCFKCLKCDSVKISMPALPGKSDKNKLAKTVTKKKKA